jgi:hypothetical protein
MHLLFGLAMDLYFVYFQSTLAETWLVMELLNCGQETLDNETAVEHPPFHWGFVVTVHSAKKFGMNLEMECC